MNNNGVNENQNIDSNSSLNAPQEVNNQAVPNSEVKSETTDNPEIIKSYTISLGKSPEELNAPKEDVTVVAANALDTFDSGSGFSVPIIAPSGTTPVSGEVQLEAMPEVKEEGPKLDIKVGALSKLKKKQQKDAEKAEAQEAFKNGKVSYKVFIAPVVIIIVLICVITYLVLSNNRNLEELKYECSPINSSKNETSIDVKSTIVQDLYKKVRTNIHEDMAQPEWNDKMKIYLAYRQVVDSDKYDSNCNLFKPNNMEPYTCVVSTNFVPEAFTVDTLKHEWKMLFGEETEMPLINIKLENSCMGGYEYIAERKEYVQGYCDYHAASLYKVTKTLVEATTFRNTLILKEEVKYYENEKMSLPKYLRSGDYYYTFKLDMNYNYVLVSKTYNSKY